MWRVNKSPWPAVSLSHWCSSIFGAHHGIHSWLRSLSKKRVLCVRVRWTLNSGRVFCLLLSLRCSLALAAAYCIWREALDSMCVCTTYCMCTHTYIFIYVYIMFIHNIYDILFPVLLSVFQGNSSLWDFFLNLSTFPNNMIAHLTPDHPSLALIK